MDKRTLSSPLGLGCCLSVFFNAVALPKRLSTISQLDYFKSSTMSIYLLIWFFLGHTLSGSYALIFPSLIETDAFLNSCVTPTKEKKTKRKITMHVDHELQHEKDAEATLRSSSPLPPWPHPGHRASSLRP